MTTSARAKTLSKAASHPFSSRASGPQKPNTLHQIKDRQGLEFQPLIFALIACVPDVESMPTKSDTHDLLCRFERALFNTGYGNKGTPYWVRKQGPSPAQIEALASAADDLIPTLNTRYRELLRANDIPALSAFQERCGMFTAAIDSLRGIVSRRNYENDHRTVFGAAHDVALT